MAWSLLDSTTAGFADGAAGHPLSYPGGQPNAGDLLILTAASDTTITTPSGWTLGVSDIVNQGDYLWYRLAGVAEADTVTLTTSGDFPTVATFLRYVGAAAAGPLDVTAVARAVNSDAATSPPVAPAALAGVGELMILAACNQEASGIGTSPVASSGYTVLADTGLTGSGSLGVQQYVIGRTDGSGSETPAVTWSGSLYRNRTALVAAFLPAATVDVTVTVPAPATAAGSAPTPGVAAAVTVTVPAPATAAADIPAPTVPLADPPPGVVGGGTSARTARLASTTHRPGGPSV